jgi:hypothetical protein
VTASQSPLPFAKSADVRATVLGQVATKVTAGSRSAAAWLNRAVSTEADPIGSDAERSTRIRDAIFTQYGRN